MLRRIFVDWQASLFERVVRDLLNGGCRRNGILDCSAIVIVVPGRRAGRRIRELLTDETDGRHCPPKIVTASELPELLYTPKLPFASDFVQQLAWRKVLQEVPPERLPELVRIPPEADDINGWLALAGLLWKQHRELAADGLDFAGVARRAAKHPNFQEHGRWRLLSEIQEKYLRLLDSLELWDIQTARLEAVRRKECRTDAQIWLVGTTDLPQIERRMLDLVCEHVTAYIHAPEELAEGFDQHGCVVPDQWRNRPIDLDIEQVTVADGPMDQVAAILSALSALDGAYCADEIAIGLADQQLAPLVERALAECGVAGYAAAGHSLADSLPARLLTAAATLLEERTTAAFAAFVRHPDVAAWLTLRGVAPGWLHQLDDFIRNHVPHDLGTWARKRRDFAGWPQAYRCVAELLRPLEKPPRTLKEWGPAISGLLQTVYGETAFSSDDDADQAVLSACSTIHDSLIGHEDVPKVLMPRVSGATALRILLRQISGELVSLRPDPAALELTGWLEIPLDDAPVVILAGVNEGLMPQSVNADPFLPDGLRSMLGLVDNARRYARDAHALTVLLHSRKVVRLIAGIRDSRGDPLTPSRLLLTADPVTVARRVQAFYRRKPVQHSIPVPAVLRPARTESAFAIPRPRPAAPLEVLRVTSFRDYIASPYRYYLRHVLQLEAVDDTIEELSGAAFGNLAHDALKQFGRSEICHSTDAAEIREFLHGALETEATRQFGPERAMAIEMQLVQARLRLEAFARWQAGWASEGWRIRFIEEPADKPCRFQLDDGREVLLSGRIDRIDHHADRNEWVIFDYKTGDGGERPERTHRQGDEWIDLQLPLYRHLAQQLGVMGRVSLGYIVLPRDTNEIGPKIAEWNEELLLEADALARELAAEILDGRFWRTLEKPPQTLREFDPICQSEVLSREVIL